MNILKLSFLLTIFVLALAPISSISANQGQTIIYSLTSPTGNLGNTENYTSSGISLSAFGYQGTTATSLYATSNGLGLNLNSPTHGIPAADFVQIDAANLVPSASNITFTFTNLTSGQGWVLYGSNVGGAPNTSNIIATGTGSGSYTVNNPQFSYYSISSSASGSSDVILAGVSANVGVPEPTTWIILGSGLILAFVFKLRNQRVKLKS
jgi:hypothetical protein